MGTSSITLLELANGSIQQEHRCELHETTGLKRHHIRFLRLLFFVPFYLLRRTRRVCVSLTAVRAQTSGIVTFLCYFQELVKYELKMTQWQGFDLKPVASAQGGVVDPYLSFSVRPYVSLSVRLIARSESLMSRLQRLAQAVP